MPDASNRTAADPLVAGWGALQRARWDAAGLLFERALAAGETPEALEGLSWAAWWRDDADAVFEARERAYRLYRKRADAAGAARMATWLTVDQLDFRGAWAVASGWLRRAHRLLHPLEPGPSTAGSRSRRATSPTPAATPRGRASWPPLRSSLDVGSASPMRCSGSRSKARRWSVARE